jgi:putative glutamine amidotransferase
MPTPLIAIPGRIGPQAENVRGDAFAVGQRYVRAVHRAGGQAVMLPPVVDGAVDPGRVLAAMRRFDGLILHGGGDISPARYGETPDTDTLYGIIEEHDAIEFAALEAALALDLPVLAICRGHQVLNVHLGGSLIQDLGTEDHWHTHHPVNVTEGSLLAQALGTLRPNACHSVHHQGLKDVAEGLVISARADDGTIEGTEMPSARWVVSVQWHPEDDAATDPVQQALFNAFVTAASTSAPFAR